MICIHAHHLNLDLISLLDTNSCFSYDLHNFFIQQRFPVLHGKHDMVMNLPCTMVSFSDSAFMIHLNSITKTRRPCSKLQGTFKLESVLSVHLLQNYTIHSRVYNHCLPINPVPYIGVGSRFRQKHCGPLNPVFLRGGNNLAIRFFCRLYHGAI
jgi:hypothetical protein